MAEGTRHWQDLFATIAGLRTPQEVQAFLRDLCTRAELDAMGPNSKSSDIFKSGAFDPAGAKKK